MAKRREDFKKRNKANPGEASQPAQGESSSPSPTTSASQMNRVVTFKNISPPKQEAASPGNEHKVAEPANQHANTVYSSPVQQPLIMAAPINHAASKLSLTPLLSHSIKEAGLNVADEALARTVQGLFGISSPVAISREIKKHDGKYYIATEFVPGSEYASAGVGLGIKTKNNSAVMLHFYTPAALRALGVPAPQVVPLLSNEHANNVHSSFPQQTSIGSNPITQQASNSYLTLLIHSIKEAGLDIADGALERMVQGLFFVSPPVTRNTEVKKHEGKYYIETQFAPGSEHASRGFGLVVKTKDNAEVTVNFFTPAYLRDLEVLAPQVVPLSSNGHGFTDLGKPPANNVQSLPPQPSVIAPNAVNNQHGDALVSTTKQGTPDAFPGLLNPAVRQYVQANVPGYSTSYRSDPGFEQAGSGQVHTVLGLGNQPRNNRYPNFYQQPVIEQALLHKAVNNQRIDNLVQQALRHAVNLGVDLRKTRLEGYFRSNVSEYQISHIGDKVSEQNGALYVRAEFEPGSRWVNTGFATSLTRSDGSNVALYFYPEKRLKALGLF